MNFTNIIATDFSCISLSVSFFIKFKNYIGYFNIINVTIQYAYAYVISPELPYSFLFGVVSYSGYIYSPINITIENIAANYLFD